jgi:hypothetical protein
MCSHALRFRSARLLRFCRTVPFWGTNPTIGYQQCPDFQTPNLSRKHRYDRTLLAVCVGMLLGFPAVLRAQGAPDPVNEAVQGIEQAAGGAVTVTRDRVTGLATFIGTGPGVCDLPRESLWPPRSLASPGRQD